jgi:lipid-A-disaccharide synthase
LAHTSQPEISREEFANLSGLNPAKLWIALLPGSRQKEVLLNLPEMLNAARLLKRQGTDYEFVLPLASTLDEQWLRSQLAGARQHIYLTTNARAALKHSRAAVVASGTATVEAALAGTPLVVVYRLTALTWLLGRRLVSLDTFAMPNLIAARRIVTELIQRDCTAANMVRELSEIIPDSLRRQQMLRDLAEVSEKLRDGGNSEAPALRAAREIVGKLP